MSWRQLSDRLAVTYLAAPLLSSSSLTSTFQIEMFYDGRIRLTYLSVLDPAGLVGLSAGLGVPSGFVVSDLTANGSCGTPAPVFRAPTVSGGLIQLQFATIAGRTYTVEYTENLAPTSWRVLQSASGNGALQTITDSINRPVPRFYRLRLD